MKLFEWNWYNLSNYKGRDQGILFLSVRTCRLATVLAKLANWIYPSCLWNDHYPFMFPVRLIASPGKLVLFHFTGSFNNRIYTRLGQFNLQKSVDVRTWRANKMAFIPQCALLICTYTYFHKQKDLHGKTHTGS